MTTLRPSDQLDATVDIAVARPELAEALVRAVGAALAGALATADPGPLSTIAARTRKRANALSAERVAGRIAIVAVSARNARHLRAIVDALRAKAPRAVQLVWDGTDRPRIERHVFAVLETARATPKSAPVLLARTPEPTWTLRFTRKEAVPC